jgi:hypothetical protein
VSKYPSKSTILPCRTLQTWTSGTSYSHTPRTHAANLRLRRPEDWAAAELGRRIDRAATELGAIVRAGVGARTADSAWSSHQHEFAGNATRAARTTGDVDLGSPLMRLAAGGSARPTGTSR